MRKFKINVLLLIGILGLFTNGSLFVVHLCRAFGGERDIYWTHQDNPLSIEDACQDFALQHKGQTLQQLLGTGSLLVREPNGDIVPTKSADWQVRLNNWHRVQASILTMSLLPCALLGASLTLLIFGIVLGVKQMPAGRGVDTEKA